jgi:hypothetical protein
LTDLSHNSHFLMVQHIGEMSFTQILRPSEALRGRTTSDTARYTYTMPAEWNMSTGQASASYTNKALPALPPIRKDKQHASVVKRPEQSPKEPQQSQKESRQPKETKQPKQQPKKQQPKQQPKQDKTFDIPDKNPRRFTHTPITSDDDSSRGHIKQATQQYTHKVVTGLALQSPVPYSPSRKVRQLMGYDLDVSEAPARVRGPISRDSTSSTESSSSVYSESDRDLPSDEFEITENYLKWDGWNPSGESPEHSTGHSAGNRSSSLYDFDKNDVYSASATDLATPDAMNTIKSFRTKDRYRSATPVLGFKPKNQLPNQFAPRKAIGLEEREEIQRLSRYDLEDDIWNQGPIPKLDPLLPAKLELAPLAPLPLHLASEPDPFVRPGSAFSDSDSDEDSDGIISHARDSLLSGVHAIAARASSRRSKDGHHRGAHGGSGGPTSVPSVTSSPNITITSMAKSSPDNNGNLKFAPSFNSGRHALKSPFPFTTTLHKRNISATSQNSGTSGHSSSSLHRISEGFNPRSASFIPSQPRSSAIESGNGSKEEIPLPDSDNVTPAQLKPVDQVQSEPNVNTFKQSTPPRVEIKILPSHLRKHGGPDTPYFSEASFGYKLDQPEDKDERQSSETRRQDIKRQSNQRQDTQRRGRQPSIDIMDAIQPTRPLRMSSAKTRAILGDDPSEYGHTPMNDATIGHKTMPIRAQSLNRRISFSKFNSDVSERSAAALKGGVQMWGSVRKGVKDFNEKALERGNSMTRSSSLASRGIKTTVASPKSTDSPYIFPQFSSRTSSGMGQNRPSDSELNRSLFKSQDDKRREKLKAQIKVVREEDEEGLEVAMKEGFQGSGFAGMKPVGIIKGGRVVHTAKPTPPLLETMTRSPMTTNERMDVWL